MKRMSIRDASPASSRSLDEQLRALYLRRAVVERLIRNLEDYSRLSLYEKRAA